MRPTTWCSLFDEWAVDADQYIFSSPLVPETAVQMLLFGTTFKNGTISCCIKPTAGRKEGDRDLREGAIVFRYNGYGQYYYAGVGGWGGKYFIGKVVQPGPTFQQLAVVGKTDTIQYDRAISIKIECRGNRIILHENNVPILEVLDDSYQTGLVGLRSHKTAVDYLGLNIEATTPSCFVVMPFTTELQYVYDVIKSTVEAHGLTCCRADETLEGRPAVEDIKDQISGADLVIVDFTGRNSNVYYEAGLADAWNKKWIILAQSTEDMTFNVRHIKAIIYSNSLGADKKLKDDLRAALRQALGVTETGPDCSEVNAT